MSISKTYLNQRFSSWPCSGQVCVPYLDAQTVHHFDSIGKHSEGEGSVVRRKSTKKVLGIFNTRERLGVLGWLCGSQSLCPPGGQSTDRVFPLPKMILLCPFPFHVWPTVQLTTFFFYFFAFRSHLLSNCQAV